MRREILALPVLLAALAGCGSGNPEPSGTPSADLRSIAQRWDGLPADVKAAVCEAAQETPETGTTDAGRIPQERPDYRGMLAVLVFNGMAQPDATAMLPYAVNECT